jgi:hypothetical protein
MITSVRKSVHERCLNFRALDRLVQTPGFEHAMQMDPNNIWVQFALINGNIEWIEDWIKKTLTKDIGEMSLRELRQLASKLNVPNYTNCSKDILLIRVQNVLRTEESVS